MKMMGNKTAERQAAHTAAVDSINKSHLAACNYDPLQLVIYALKLSEARILLHLATTTTAPVAKDWPMLSAEVGVTGKTLLEVAQKIVDSEQIPIQALAKIEASRIAALANVTA